MPSHWLGANTAHPFHPTRANPADLSCEEALYENASLRRFVGIDLGRESVPVSTTITKFRKLPNKKKLGEALFTKVGQELPAGGFKANVIIGAPKQWRFGMKLHIGVGNRSMPSKQRSRHGRQPTHPSRWRHCR